MLAESTTESKALSQLKEQQSQQQKELLDQLADEEKQRQAEIQQNEALEKKIAMAEKERKNEELVYIVILKQEVLYNFIPIYRNCLTIVQYRNK